jgi:mRNA interferase MazF
MMKMRSGIMYKQGDIVLIPIPFTDLQSSKIRPVIVVSNNNYNNIMKDMLVSAITSNITSKEYSIPIDNDDLDTGKLIKPSMIRTDKLYSLSQDIVKKKIAHSKEAILENIKMQINFLCK